MKPILFSIGPVHFHSFGLLVALGVFVSLAIMTRQFNRFVSTRKEDILDMVLVVILSGFIGGRLAYIIQFRNWYIQNPAKILAIWEGGLIFFGGMIGAFIGMILFARMRKIPFLPMLDFLVPFIALTHAFGRMGCFLNGCCYGKACDLPWAVHFPKLHEGVHPTQLYEALFAVVLAVFLWKLFLKKKFDGQVTLLYFMFYSIGRFSIEFFRAKNPMLYFFTWNQWLSIAIFLGAFLFYFPVARGALKNAK